MNRRNLLKALAISLGNVAYSLSHAQTLDIHTVSLAERVKSRVVVDAVVELGGSTRFVFRSALPFRVRHYRLKSPDRLVVDFEHAELYNINLIKQFSNRDVSSVRVGHPLSATVRVVFDLSVGADTVPPREFQIDTTIRALEQGRGSQFVVDIGHKGDNKKDTPAPEELSTQQQQDVSDPVSTDSSAEVAQNETKDSPENSTASSEAVERQIIRVQDFQNTEDDLHIVFASDQAIRYEYFQLDNPDRLVIDFFWASLHGTDVLTGFFNSAIAAVRFGHPTENRFRVVCDLRQDVKIDPIFTTNQVGTLLDLHLKSLGNGQNSTLQEKKKGEISLADSKEATDPENDVLDDKRPDLIQATDGKEKINQQSEMKHDPEPVSGSESVSGKNAVLSQETKEKSEQGVENRLSSPREGGKLVQDENKINIPTPKKREKLEQREEKVTFSQKIGEKQGKNDEIAPKQIQLKHLEKIVVIDPGHGGIDPGTIGTEGTKEKDVTLAVAMRLAEEVERKSGYRVVLTRKNDCYIPLSRRLEITQSHQADLFISLHADAFRDSRIHGASVYCLGQVDNHGEVQNSNLLEQEKMSVLEANGRGGSRSIFPPQATSYPRHYYTNANRFGRRLLKSLSSEKNINIQYSRVKRAQFKVLHTQGIPAALVEMGFLSNLGDERKIRDEVYQNTLSIALSQGIIHQLSHS